MSWDAQRIIAKTNEIDDVAKESADKLGAQRCVLIAFFFEGEHCTILDGGTTPIPARQLFTALLNGAKGMKTVGPHKYVEDR